MRISDWSSDVCSSDLVSLTVTVWLWLVRDERLVDAFRLVTFNVVSVVTTTGFATTDYGQWGGLAVVVFFILTFIGGCTGSTAGGIKMLRLELAALMVRNQFQRLYQPHGILIIRYRGPAVADDVVKSAMNFIFIRSEEEHT